MDLWSHDRFTFPLPATHRFPLTKYARLRARLEADGIARPDEIHECEPVPWDWIEAVQQPALVERLRDGTLSVREQRGLGLPWSPELVERARRTTAGTVAAARRALRARRRHEPRRRHPPRRLRLRPRLLPVQRRRRRARPRARRRTASRRALVVDCDVHQGDGTAQALAADAEAFTRVAARRAQLPLPAHPVRPRRRPPDRDRRREYLRALDEALDAALPRARPDVAFYLAGADPFEGDRLGRLALTKAGLRARDELVVERLRGAGAAVVVVLAGGYAHDVEDTVDINAATAAVWPRPTRPASLGLGVVGARRCAGSCDVLPGGHAGGGLDEARRVVARVGDLRHALAARVLAVEVAEHHVLVALRAGERVGRRVGVAARGRRALRVHARRSRGRSGRTGAGSGPSRGR